MDSRGSNSNRRPTTSPENVGTYIVTSVEQINLKLLNVKKMHELIDSNKTE
jgi:hypothetical protein